MRGELQTEKGIGRFGKSTLAFLCGVVVVWEPVALHGVGDGAGVNRRIFDLFDLNKGGVELPRTAARLLTLAQRWKRFSSSNGGGPRL